MSFIVKEFSRNNDIFYSKVAALGTQNYLFFAFTRLINKAGSKTRLVHVAVTSVIEVSHPNACVPPNPLKLNIINPAINTSEVYIMLIPVLCIVSITVLRMSNC